MAKIEVTEEDLLRQSEDILITLDNGMKLAQRIRDAMQRQSKNKYQVA